MEAVAERKIDWKSLLARTSKPAARPNGFADTAAVRRRIQGGETVSGLVVSIGVEHDAEGAIPEQVVIFLGSLARSDEFAYRQSGDEFVFICPENRGAAAQRRLAQISRELWDFQLRSLGNFAILFSWGGVDVDNELIEEAVAIATMRMQETRRARKALMSR